MIKIRKGKIEDIPQLWKIEIESSKHHQKIISKKFWKFEVNETKEISKKDFIKNFSESMKDKNSFFIVAEENNEILGYLSVDLFYSDSFSKKKKSLYVSELGVLKKYSRKGIATKLIKYLEKLAKDGNYKFIAINVKPNNKPARELYVKNKFEIYDMQFLKKIK